MINSSLGFCQLEIWYKNRFNTNILQQQGPLLSQVMSHVVLPEVWDEKINQKYVWNSEDMSKLDIHENCTDKNWHTKQVVHPHIGSHQGKLKPGWRHAEKSETEILDRTCVGLLQRFNERKIVCRWWKQTMNLVQFTLQTFGQI